MNWIERWWPAFKRRIAEGPFMGRGWFGGPPIPPLTNCRCMILPQDAKVTVGPTQNIVTVNGVVIGQVTEVSFNLPEEMGPPAPPLPVGPVTVSGTLTCHGLEAGEVCGRDGCEERLVSTNPDDPDGGCTCFRRPPCSHCMGTRANCPGCGWAADPP